MRESFAALEISVRLRYLRPLSAEQEDRIDRISATLYRISFSHSAAR